MTLHTRVFPTLFSSLVCRKGDQGTGTLMQHFKKHLKMTHVTSLGFLVIQVTRRVSKFGNNRGCQQVCKWKSFRIWAMFRLCCAENCRSSPNTVHKCCHWWDRRGVFCTAPCRAGCSAWPLPKSIELRDCLVSL